MLHSGHRVQAKVPQLPQLQYPPFMHLAAMPCQTQHLEAPSAICVPRSLPLRLHRIYQQTCRPGKCTVLPLCAGVDPKSIVTVVGNLPHAAKGQQLRFVGDWVLHPKHSWQLKATAYEEVVPRSPQAVAAYLASTIDGELPLCLVREEEASLTHAAVMCALVASATMLTTSVPKTTTHHLINTSHSAGVGSATATKLVDAFGTNVLGLMDSDDCVRALSGVDNIGRTRAANIKQLWDASRGTSHAAPLHLTMSVSPLREPNWQRLPV